MGIIPRSKPDNSSGGLSSTCTVFAESEVVSLIGRGEDSRRVALGIHRAIAGRVGAMARRVGVREGRALLNPLPFLGQVGKEPGLAQRAEDEPAEHAA
jgi:activator of 2-hydroxyglutaryl-CoA dehydratase